MVKQVCSKCKEAKEASKEFFPVNVRYLSGLSSHCRVCVNAASRARYKINPEKSIARAVAWTKANPEKAKAHMAACRKKNGEKYRETNRASTKRWNQANPDRLKAKNKAWAKANPAKCVARSREWQKANPAKCAAISQKRRAAKLSAVPKWADDAKTLAVYARAAKKTADTGIPHHVDHRVPLQNPRVCGLHWHANLRVIPAKDNMSKGNRAWPGMP